MLEYSLRTDRKEWHTGAYHFCFCKIFVVSVAVSQKGDGVYFSMDT